MYVSNSLYTHTHTHLTNLLVQLLQEDNSVTLWHIVTYCFMVKVKPNEFETKTSN